MATELETIRYEIVEETIARITLNRPEVRNAQSHRMTYELNDAFTAATFDEGVKVIVLAAEGPHFSSGHDLKDLGGPDHDPVGIHGPSKGFDVEHYMALEEEVYLHMCRRWQQIPKPTIAQVHGKTIAGGLMLMWVCDLIVASDDATFADPTLNFGVNGVEWFAHPYELGVRKAKELLFTGEALSAEEAKALGMVNHVVARDQLESFTTDLARRIAGRPSFALKLAKMACNQALDAQGFWNAQQSAFSLQHLGHSWMRERSMAPSKSADR